MLLFLVFPPFFHVDGLQPMSILIPLKPLLQITSPVRPASIPGIHMARQRARYQIPLYTIVAEHSSGRASFSGYGIKLNRDPRRMVPACGRKHTSLRLVTQGIQTCRPVVCAAMPHSHLMYSPSYINGLWNGGRNWRRADAGRGGRRCRTSCLLAAISETGKCFD